MAEVDVLNIKGERISQVELPNEIYNLEINQGLLHEIIRMQLAKRRSGTASTKGRSVVSGSRRKLYRQKGTGRARSGDIKSPLRKGGGIIFGPLPRSYEFQLPKKVKRLGLKMALSSKYKNNELLVINGFLLQEIKTKHLANILKGFNITKALIISDEKDDNLKLSARNIEG
ncbi:MAG: 50S ribosomal protein L4, partial [Desulfobacterales bacterium]|nr:50S ribosomal protein L4 [Desulfobacterales bacterium]